MKLSQKFFSVTPSKNLSYNNNLGLNQIKFKDLGLVVLDTPKGVRGQSEQDSSLPLRIGPYSSPGGNHSG